jgi:hypothetical protein
MAQSDQRTIIVSDVGFKPTKQKQPGDIFAYTFDFTSWLDTGITIASAASSLEGQNGTDPVIDSTTVTGSSKMIVLVISGGDDGWNGTVTVQATLSDGEIKEAEFDLIVREVGFTT